MAEGHSILSFLLIALLTVNYSHGRVSVAPDGSITLSATQGGGVVHVEGDLVVSQRSIGGNLNSILATLDNANQLALFSLSALRWQALTVPNARSSTNFSTSTDQYLVVANGASTTQYLYHWNPTNNNFDPPVFFNNTPPKGFTVFTLNGTLCIIDANPTGASTRRQWDPVAKNWSPVVIDSPSIDPTFSWTFFDSGTYQYLAQATPATYAKSLFLYTGGTWIRHVTSATTGSDANDWNFFTINNVYYAVLSLNGSSSELYSSTDALGWPSQGTIPTIQAFASKAFVSRGNTYLVFAENKPSPSGGYVSEVYVWNSTLATFQLASTFPVQGARGVELITIGNGRYCLITNVNDGVSTTPPQLYRWNPYLATFTFVSQTDPNFQNNNHARFFSVGTGNYLYIAQSSSPSYVYKLGIV